eukprot:TRINITY_DN3724_c0_g2_i2.p1 TRINITY_DN3724_c0_g2~~TRINITY_DN3724_c0_g2_i2.p1  ORF type:complete len:476 (+),score=111.08 TRINITY_DN3724_c0_g2_i2:314-1741(+)
MTVSDEDKARAVDIKNEANKFFQEGRYARAIDGYTKAIELDDTNAVYYSNRAFAHMRMEGYGAAIEDATKAIELDPTYPKGYYRRASAQMVLGHPKKALSDFKKALKLNPSSADARAKVKACEKEVRRIAFEEAIAGEEEKRISEQIELENISVPDDYDGPRIGEDGITEEFVDAMIEHFVNQKIIHRRYALQILLEANTLLRSLPPVTEVEPREKFTVCGDVHGQFYDVVNLFKINGKPGPNNPYLFNGDFVDRGSFSVEVILTFLAYRVLYPQDFHLQRGNHETKNMNMMYGFLGEVEHKYNRQMYDLFCEVFQALPICAVLGQKIFVVHGGLFSKDGVKIEDLRKIDRFCEPPEGSLMSEALWSDPQKWPGRGPSKRGLGSAFGPDVTKAFLQDNGLELVVRSHEVKDEGYEVEADGHLVTVFSAPNYCDQIGNKAAFVTFGLDMKPTYTSFEAVPHPNIPPMHYAKSVYGI